MLEQVSAVPVGALIEEVEFSLLALATRNGVILDGKDWYGSLQADFGDARKSAWPFLDLTIRPPTGSLNVNLQFGVPTFPIAEPPVLTFTTFFSIGVLGGAWGSFKHRIDARFSRIQILDTSNAANNTIYLQYSVRGN